MSPWAVLDSCIIRKGEGHYDFDTLIQQLIGMTDANGLQAMPRPMEDIGGGAMTGVEADAVWEAIYQGLVDQNVAAIVHAGPQPGMEGIYQQAVRAAVAAGSGTINQAVETQNAIWEEERNKMMMEGKDPSKVPMPLPPPFVGDLGGVVLAPQWANGVWGAMDKKNPWTVNAQGEMQLRIGNRDKENKFAESWARPYAEGLKQMRGGRNTKDFIESHRVQPNSVYINHEAGKHIYDLMDSLARQGYTKENLTPDVVKQIWASHPVLSNYMPHQLTPLQHSYNVRNTAPHVEQPDPAEQMVEQQQNQVPTADDFRTWMPEGALQTKRGVDLIDRAHANFRHYGPVLHQVFGSQHNFPEDFSMEDAMNMGTGRNRVTRLMSGMAAYLEQQNPGMVPEHVTDPSTLVRPGVQQRQAQVPPVPDDPPQGAQDPIPQRDIAPPPPPVPVEPPAPPVPKQQEVPHPPQEPIQRPNVEEVAPPPREQVPTGTEGQPGMAERIAGAAGRGLGSAAGRIMGLFGKEEIDSALEAVQRDLALTDDRIVKSLPHTSFSTNNPMDVAMCASQFGIPATSIVAVLNSRGHWGEIAKSMDMDEHTFQTIKVAFS